MNPLSLRERVGVRGAIVGVLLLSALPANALDSPTYLGPAPPKEVRRVITLAPSLSEVVVALGATERLVGVSRFDELPQVAPLPRVGGFIDPSVEKVVSLRPDLVLVQPAPGNEAPVRKMAELGVPVLALPMHSVASTCTALREVGRALGLSGRAEKLVQALEETRAQVRARAAKLPQRKVLFVVEFSPLVVAGPGSFADELLADAGATNAAADARSPFTVYSVESALKAKPDVVVDGAHQSQGAQKLRALPGLAKARWVKLPSQDLLHPGPSLGRGLWELFFLLHPETKEER
ncbi:MAG: ABC transporter substrate-binding protein [Myxococcota bacterium]